jgi:hypothetical protein
MRRKEILLVLPCETGVVCIKRFLFSAFCNVAVHKYKKNNMRSCIPKIGVRFRSRLRCHNKSESESDDAPGAFHVILLPNPVRQDRLDAAAEWSRLGNAPGG